MSAVLLSDVKKALDKTLTVDDPELQDVLDDAEAEYAEWVLGLPGQDIASSSVTQIFDGGTDTLELRAPHVTAITAASYTDGTALAFGELVLNTVDGTVGWLPNTSGWFTAGTRNVSITYTLGPLPGNHRRAIVLDVAGYYATTQRGSSAGAFPGEDTYGEAAAAYPVTIFPRIRALRPRANW